MTPNDILLWSYIRLIPATDGTGTETHSQTSGGDSLNGRSPSNPSPRVQGTPQKRRWKHCKSQRGPEDTGRARPSQGPKRGTYELTETKQQARAYTVRTRPSLPGQQLLVSILWDS